MGTTSSINMQSLGKIVQRAPAVGAKMWCLSLCFLSVTLLVRSAVRSRGAQFEHALRCRLQADFDEDYSVFFTSDCFFRHATQFSHWLLGGATIVVKLRSKIAKSPKIGGKVCAHHFVQIAEGFEKNVLQQFRAETVDVHLYKKFFSTCRYLALTATIKVRISSPKTARNEQVCPHQKSYRK